MNKLSIALRIIMGVGVVLLGLTAGFLKRSPWIILPLGVAFTVLFILGKLRHWRIGYQQEGLKGLAAALPQTILVQLILVGLLYFVGLGFGFLLYPVGYVQQFGRFDVIYTLATLCGAGMVGGLIALIERDLPDPIQRALSRFESDVDEEDAFYSRHSYHERDVLVLRDSMTPEALFHSDGVPASQGELRATQERLGFLLPESLSAIYRVQNGGLVTDIVVPMTEEDPEDDLSEVRHWFNPFGGNNELWPLQRLKTLYDVICEHADPDDPDYADQFPAGCETMIVLSRWYDQTLFLDYGSGASPVVGYVDFKKSDWMERAIYWPDFETFFGLLRRRADIPD